MKNKKKLKNKKKNKSIIVHANTYEPWLEFISTCMDYDLFVTFEYDISQSDYHAKKGMSFLLKAVQRAVYPNSYKKNNDCFQGFSIAERHKKSIKKFGKFHFHNLISLGSIEVTDELIAKIEKVFEDKAHKLSYNRKPYDKKIAISPTAIDFQVVTNDQEKLSRYCLKDSMKDKLTGSHISPIDWEGANKYERIAKILDKCA